MRPEELLRLYPAETLPRREIGRVPPAGGGRVAQRPNPSLGLSQRRREPGLIPRRLRTTTAHIAPHRP